jgi:hypothetical protein
MILKKFQSGILRKAAQGGTFETKAFELAVDEAESRGSTYWEFEEHIVH